MKSRRFIACLLLSIAALIVAELTVLPPAALALSGDPFTTTENTSFVTSVMKDINALPTLPPGTVNPSTGVAYTTAEEFGGLAQARMAGGFGIPAMNALGTIAIGGTAIYAAYQLGDFFRAKISGDNGATVTGPTVPQWVPYCSTGNGENGSTCAFTGGSWSAANFGGFGNPATGQVGTGSTFAPTTNYWVLQMSANVPFCAVAGSPNCTGANSTNVATAIATEQSIVANAPTLTNVSPNTTAGSLDCKAVGACVIVWRTFAQMRAATHQEQCNAACYTAGNTKVSLSATTANGANANNFQSAIEQCGGFLGNSVGNAQQEACRAALNYQVNPGCATDGTNCVGSATAGATVTIPGGGGSGTSFQAFVLPQPQLDESYQDYIQELRDKGYVGTITVDEADPAGWLSTAAARGVPDGTMIGAKVGSGTEIYQYEPLTGDLNSPQWPDNPDQIPTSTTAITITKTPTGTFDPAAPTPSVSDCSTCAIDWTPLESLSVGSKFPFGVPAWFYDFFDGISFSSSCPTLDIGKPAALGGGTIGIPFCNTEWETTYRPIIFPILEALMTIAGVVFLGGKILGTSGANDE